MQRVTLHAANITIPMVGLGTWKAKPEEMDKAVECAINAGYRHFDTAFNYNTEEPLGAALKRLMAEGVVKREDLFITTKLPVFGNRASDVERFMKMSLDKLKMDYVDLYLVHMPFAFSCDTCFKPVMNEDGTVCLDLEANLLETWKAMEEQVKSGRAKAIGVSNFNIEQVRRIYKSAAIKPSMLQVEVHAYNQQQQLVDACQEMNIAVTAYSPLCSPSAQSHFQEKYNHLREIPCLLEDAIVTQIASKLDKTPGQILLRYLIQRNIIVIPKSANCERIQQNISLFDFELSKEDMAQINALNRGEQGRIFDFLFFKGVDKHPEYPFKKI